MKRRRVPSVHVDTHTHTRLTLSWFLVRHLLSMARQELLQLLCSLTLPKVKWRWRYCPHSESRCPFTVASISFLMPYTVTPGLNSQFSSFFSHNFNNFSHYLWHSAILLWHSWMNFFLILLHTQWNFSIR